MKTRYPPTRNAEGMIILIFIGLCTIIITGIALTPFHKIADYQTAAPPIATTASSVPSISGNPSAGTIYTNRAYHYEIMYPSRWRVTTYALYDNRSSPHIELNQQPSVVFTPDPPCPNCGGGGPRGFNVYIHTLTRTISSQEYVRENILSVYAQRHLKLVPQARSANYPGLDATIVTGLLGGAGCAGPKMVIVRDTRVVEITTTCLSGDRDKDQALYAHALSSFRFLP